MTKHLHCLIHPNEENQYYAIQDDGVLALYQSGQREPLQAYPAVIQLLTYAGEDSVIVLDEAGKEQQSYRNNPALPYDRSYTMELVWPWLSIFQQYGTNGCVYQMETGATRVFSRENYHAEVSSFSNALLHHAGQVCLLHQTQWNRLDITNLETGQLLTEREIYYRLLEETDEQGSRTYEQKNYVDYFHGRLFLSPDQQYFVDTGWVWQPVGVPKLYRIADFLTNYEKSEIQLSVKDTLIYGEDWDQSVVWLDDQTFLLNFFPDLDLLDEDDTFFQEARAVLLQFHVAQIQPSDSRYAKEELLAEKALPFPFVPTPVQSYWQTSEGKMLYYAQMLNVELYWDAQAQLLIGINGNELFVQDQASGVSYCLRYGNTQCFYSIVHHVAYQLPPWQGNFPHGQIRELLNAARGFYFMPAKPR